MLAQGAADAVDGIFRREEDGGDALTEGGEGRFAGADEGGFLAVGVGADDLEIRGGMEAFVARAGGEDNDIPRSDMEFLSIFPTEEESGLPTGDAEDFVVIRVEMMIVINSPAPARAPAVSGEVSLKPSGGILGLNGGGATQEDDGEMRVVGGFPVVGEAAGLDGGGRRGHGIFSGSLRAMQRISRFALDGFAPCHGVATGRACP